MKMKNPLVSVIIPTNNQRELLRECLESFAEREYDPVELIVVDNGSKDGSREMVRSEFPEVRLLTFKAERGLGYITNRGIMAAKGEILAVGFNNDEVMKPGWIATLVDILQTNSDVGIVGGLRIQYQERDIVDSAGGRLTIFGQKNYNGSSVSELPDADLLFVDFVEVPVFHRDILDDVGLLDENYHFYSEDTDFCLRAGNCGYNVAVSLDAISYHRRGATSSQSEMSRYFSERNRLRVLLKNLCISRLIPILVFWYVIRFPIKISLILLGRGVDDRGLATKERWATRVRHIGLFLSAIWWNVRHLDETLKHRSKVRASS